MMIHDDDAVQFSTNNCYQDLRVHREDSKKMSSHPRWHALIQSCLQREPGPVSKFMQLATLTTDGQPAVRTVVFRGWHPFTTPSNAGRDSLSLLTTTDVRSQKIEELIRHPYAEICWYFQESRQQFRVTGTVTIIKNNEADSNLAHTRIQVWKNLSPSARLQFAYPKPGDPRQEHLDSQLFKTSPLDENQPLDSFSLIMIKAARVDFVDLRQNQRILFKHDSNGLWSQLEVNP